MANFEELRAKADRMIRAVMRHRDRYLKAWIAQTGLLPSDCVLVERSAFDRKTLSMVLVVETVSKEEAARRFGP